MAQKEIKLLQQQIDKLYTSDFELAPWKKYTVVLLERIFGPGTEKIRMINEIDFEFSSWSLRDASGNESYEERSIKEAQEILQAAIDELKVVVQKLKELKDKDIPVYIIAGSHDFSENSTNWRAVYKYNPSRNYVKVILELRTELKRAIQG